MSVYKNNFSRELLEIYRMGLFPMADSVDDKEIYIVSPERRGLLPITDIHIPRSLLKKLKKYPFNITIDKDFENVIRSCAEINSKRKESWINEIIIESFLSLHKKGYAHSVETWDKEGNLVGGLYGIEIGSVFCGESMFSKANDASKIALIHLCSRLWKGNFKILDCQFVNSHLKQFGCYEIEAQEYKKMLNEAKDEKADFLLKECESYKDEYSLLVSYLDMRNKNL